jgi:hypothetical protein
LLPKLSLFEASTCLQLPASGDCKLTGDTQCAVQLLTAWLCLQGFMCLFGLVAIAFAIYGMASVKKDVTDDAFAVVSTIANYTTGVTDTVDRLMDTIGGVSGIIDDFQAIIVNDLDIDGIMTNLTVGLCSVCAY